MKLNWLTGEADEALNKLESAPFDPDPDKQRAHLDKVYKIIRDDFTAQYSKMAQGAHLTLRQALRCKRVQVSTGGFQVHAPEQARARGNNQHG